MARIGVDIDGVLADFNSCYAGLIRDLLGLRVPPVNNDYPNEWNYHYTAGVTEDQEAILYRVMTSQKLWAELRAYNDAKGFANWYKTNQHRHDIYFITSRHADATVKEQTEDWLDDFLHHGEYDRPITVLMSKDKGRLAKALQLDYMIEDKPETLESMPDGVHRILIDQPWNRSHLEVDWRKIGPVHLGIPAASKLLKRVPNATMAAQLIEELEDGKR